MTLQQDSTEAGAAGERRSKKVAVSVTLTINPEAWERAYGECGPGDVRRYVLNMLQASAAADEGGIVAVAVKGA